MDTIHSAHAQKLAMNDDPSLVMLVDDDAAVRSSMARLLSSAHLPFAVFESAEEFLANVPASARGCAIIDVHLPRTSGLVLQKIVTLKHPNLAVVVITGGDDEHAEKRALAAGAIAFLRKPFDAEGLLALLKKLLVQANQI